jgi:hypothetical protein
LIDYLNTHAEQIVLIVVIFLALFSLLVFVGAICSRWLLNSSEKRKARIRSDLSNLVIQYISNDISFEDIKLELTTKTDYAILLQISNELDRSLEGEEAERLKRLMNLQPIRSYFEDRFESKNPLERAKACLYFSKKTNIKQTLIPAIVKQTGEEHPMLAYAACMVIINHGSAEQKKSAIENLLQNDGLSNQALNDIFAEFQQKSADDDTGGAGLLMDLIKKGRFTDHRTALMIRTLGELGYFQSADFLLEKFFELLKTGYDPEVTVALIDILVKFGMAEIIDRLHEQFVHSKHSEVREAVAKGLGIFCKKESIPFLKELLIDQDFYVRFHAATSLSNFPEIDLRKLKTPAMDEKEYNELLGEIEASKEGGY